MMNIAGLTPVNDPAYRYKMPKLVGKVEGRGNGIKTVLVNVNDVALALKREPAEVTKFFGCELGAQTTFSDDRAVVNGAHRDADLQVQLSKYIEHFVLCANCRLPETHYKIKDGIISQKCLACGHRESVDMRHKLTTFILGQYKKAKEQAKKDGKKEGKDDKKKDKESKKDKEKEREKDKEDSSSKKSKKSKSDKDATNGTTVFTAVEEAAAAVEEEEDEPESKVIEDSIEHFKNYLASHPTATTAEKVEELRNITTMNALPAASRIAIFLGAVCPENFIAAKTVETQSETLQALANGEINQRQMLAALEWLVGTRFPASARVVAKALMQLYDAEVVEEDVFLAWAGDTIKNEFTVHDTMIDYDTIEAVRGHAMPFVKWLQEAEEEGEEDEEDDDEEEDGEDEEDEEDDA